MCGIRQISDFTNNVDLIYISESDGLCTFFFFFFQSLTKGVEVSNPVLQCVVTIRFIAHCLQVIKVILLHHLHLVF